MIKPSINMLNRELRELFPDFKITSDLDKIDRIKEKFNNGINYHALYGSSTLFLPKLKEYRTSIDFIRWHNENVYKNLN